LKLLREISGIGTLVRVLECVFCWRVKPSTNAELRESDAIVGLSFGHWGSAPGLSNIVLAGCIFNLNKFLLLPLILQREIGDALPGKHQKDKLFLISEHQEPGKYLDTYEVLRQAWEIAKEQGWTKIVLVAHPAHLWRCKMVAERLGFVVRPRRYVIPYDRESHQIWTRSPLLFIPREIVSRLIYLLKGWI
jgi:hypothetical protein